MVQKRLPDRNRVVPLIVKKTDYFWMTIFLVNVTSLKVKV